jgi:EmrB/QacA subfamily drug resistance transporter
VDAHPQRYVNPWVITFSVMLATFMEVLDTTVVNVSIPHIAGNLASTNEEGTWVVTSYLVSNAIVLPISGWLANHMGRKRLLLTCVAGFTVTSLCCGLATSLTQLIIFRVLQGLTGGGLQPLAQAILLETFPKERHGHAMAALGIGILLAPILGPTLGGWITDNYSWRWIFYLNLPVGVLSLFLMNKFVFDPHYVKRSGARVDLWGIGFLALGIGALQIVLDTGQRKDWFSSQYIRVFAALCVFGLAALIIRELMTDHPVVDLRVLRNRSFSAGVFLISMLGFVLYASLVLLPLYLQTLMGYPAYNSGLALSPRGIGALLFTPLAGHLTTKTDPRRLLVVGMVLGSSVAGSRPQLSFHPAHVAGYVADLTGENGKRDQHFQPDAQHRRQRWYRHDDHLPGAARAGASEPSGGERHCGERADRKTAAGHASEFRRPRHRRRYSFAQGHRCDLWNGATARGHARVCRSVLDHGSRIPSDAALPATIAILQGGSSADGRA